MGREVLRLFIILLLTSRPGPTEAQWSPSGAPVCVLPSPQSSPSLAPDGAGGAFVAWVDERPGNPLDIDVYAQHLTSSGSPAPGWETNGVLVGGAGGINFCPQVISDGAGGALAAWQSDNTIYIQRFAESGQPAPGWPPNGVRVSTLAEWLSRPRIVPDGMGGAYVSFESIRRVCTPKDPSICFAFDSDVYVQRITASGLVASGWPAEGQLLEGYFDPSIGFSIDRSMAQDGEGGVIIAWVAPFDPYYPIAPGPGVILDRWTAARSHVAGWPARVTNDSVAVNDLRIISDGAGGAFAAWSRHHVVVQRVAGDGGIASGWPSGGIPVSGLSSAQTASRVVPDGEGGVLVLWNDGRPSESGIYGQRLTSAGAIASGWNENGQRIVPVQSVFEAVQDGAGGAILTWSDGRNGDIDVFAQHVTNSGALSAGWPDSGRAVCVAPGSQTKPTPVADGLGGAITAWEDFRSGTNFDIYAQRVRPDGTLGADCPLTPMSLDLAPSTLNLLSRGRSVTATLEPEPPASPADIDIASIRLNGNVPVDRSGPTSIGDADQDGRPDLTFKFDRAAVELAVEEGDAVTVTVTGEIGSGCFEVTDVIRVTRGHVSAPTAGNVFQGEGATEVRWDTPADIDVPSVGVLFSTDDGATWNLAARELPNTGSYLWKVPGTGTDRARIAVVVESADRSGPAVDGVLGISDRFAIASVLGVGSESVGFALHGAVPNPSRGLSVSFRLHDAEPATLAVYDVSGREVGRREVGGLGAGRHVVMLEAPGTLAPGIYLVHLVQGNRRLVARAVVVQ